MDVLHKLVQGTGCSVDGTVSAQNPLTKAINNVLQSKAFHINAIANDSPVIVQQNTNHPVQQTQQLGFSGQEHRIEKLKMKAMERNAIMSAPARHYLSESYGLMEAAFRESNIRPMSHAPPLMIQQFSSQDSWISEFQNLQLIDPRSAHMNFKQHELAWQQSQASNSIKHATRMEEAWTTSQFSNIDEKVETIQTSNDIAETLRQNRSAKFQNSQFLQFMSEIGEGKVDLGELSQEMRMANVWEESSFQQNDTFESAWQNSGGTSVLTQQENRLHEAWEDSDRSGVDSNKFEEAWNSQQPDNLEALWEKALRDAQSSDVFEDVWGESSHNEDSQYIYKSDNPYLNQTENFERGVRLFKSGPLAEAIYAFEAEVQQHPENSEAWRMLGESHAENDEDKGAIKCLERAIEEDPYNLDALLALGVSLVNEVDSQGALVALKSWVKHNPKFHGLEIRNDEYSDGSLMDEVMQFMLHAQAHDPEDTDVKVVLGVLYSVSRDYDAAIHNFRFAAQHRPNEHSLWNKLGATLANSSHSAEAIPAYLRALELKPRYARGWQNLGISHANLGNYKSAANCYLQALSLNDQADHIWSYLRVCFTCMERFDLVQATESRDLQQFRDEFKILNM
uniref:Peroxisomal targeting signal 1 receptor putative n=1 Tax=Albugo laibachii Nc14 TaxID=890382 RepID=F0WGU3_9STRA|nr:peroxisomal targeting signal 1 receptor putative [Albugo laibachii Nc14]|eukprot:CCA20458.1 peroxisomal targeting signal 1 receptor putative [Albugo laibachii Nc14]